MDDAPIVPRRSSRGWVAIAAAVALALAVAGIAYAVVYAPDATPGVEGLSPVGRSFSAEDGVLPPGPYDAAFSPNGARLAALGDTGLFLADEGKLEPIVRTTAAGASRLAAFAWMPTSDRLLVADGPVARKVNVVDLKGAVVAAATLSTPLQLEGGHGLTVDSTNRRAVAVHVVRDPIGGQRHFNLAIIELETGQVQILDTPDVEETQPFFVDDDTVLVTIDAENRSRPALVDLASGERTFIAPKGIGVGSIRDSDSPAIEVVDPKDDERRVIRAGKQTLGRLSKGATLVALHPAGAAGVERVLVPDGTTRLRLLALDPPRF